MSYQEICTVANYYICGVPVQPQRAYYTHNMTTWPSSICLLYLSFIFVANVDHTISVQGTGDSTLDHQATTPSASAPVTHFHKNLMFHTLGVDVHQFLCVQNQAQSSELLVMFSDILSFYLVSHVYWWMWFALI